MKKNAFVVAAAVLGGVAVLGLAGGCGSLLPKPPAAAARYAVPVGTLPEAEGPEAGAGERWAVGRVRASREAAGFAIRAVDAESGRAAFYGGGELVAPPEELVARQLRKAIAAAKPKAVVGDASMAGRGTGATLVEAWIEEFLLAREGEAWSFVMDATVYVTGPDGETAVRRATAEVPVASEGGKEPAPKAVTAAIGEAVGAVW